MADILATIRQMEADGVPEEQIQRLVASYKQRQPEAMYAANVEAANQPNTEMKTAQDRLSTEAGIAPDVPWQTHVKAGLGVAAGAGLIGAGMAAGPAALATGASRLLTSPAVSGAAGAYQGYKHGGVMGGLAGGVEGALLGKAFGGGVGRLGRLLSRAPAVVQAGPRAAAAAETLIKSPQEIAAAEQLAKIARMEASRRGLFSAAGEAAKVWPK